MFQTYQDESLYCLSVQIIQKFIDVDDNSILNLLMKKIIQGDNLTILFTSD